MLLLSNFKGTKIRIRIEPMGRRHLIIPIFIPHEGCPYRCVFCNQSSITGVRRKVVEEKVTGTINNYFRNKSTDELPKNRELAFYGGSFTGISQERQENLLSLIQPWIGDGRIQSIRVSTHCLYIDSRRLELLKRFGVRTVELGLQSTDPEVLRLSGRPCSMETVRSAAGLIREFGFQLGLQLMPGLPGDCEITFQKSIDDTIELKPYFVRLYPSLVIRNTQLHDLYLKNEYLPWSLERTVASLVEATRKFKKAKIPVIRMGLHQDPSLMGNLVDGPFHPALKYLVDSRIAYESMVEKINKMETVPRSVMFNVPMRYISIYIGNKRENINRLKALFYLKEVKLNPVSDYAEFELVA